MENQDGSGSHTSHLSATLTLPQTANRAADGQWPIHSVLEKLGPATSSHCTFEKSLGDINGHFNE